LLATSLGETGILRNPNLLKNSATGLLPAIEPGPIEAFFNRVRRTYVDKDASLVNGLLHDVSLGILPNAERPDEPVVVDRQVSLPGISQQIRERDYREYRHTIRRVKVLGPLAVTLTDLHTTVDGRSETKPGGLNVLCRSPTGWRCGLWVAGDWSDALGR
jgi:hypothetical protein